MKNVAQLQLNSRNLGSRMMVSGRLVPQENVKERIGRYLNQTKSLGTMITEKPVMINFMCQLPRLWCSDIWTNILDVSAKVFFG